MRKNFVALVTCACFLLAQVPLEILLRAQTDAAPPTLSESDLEQLVAPIALYPDPLLALILPASTVPTDIVLAQRYLDNGGDPNAIDQQPWDDNVKGLARYPEVLQMMDQNLDWTNQLGAAVLAQQPDVMNAIQAMRAKAQALGNLQTTAQQQVISQDQIIQIVPADPQVIYVPVYNPTVVYVQQAPAVPLITFGVGLAMGIWIGGDCDWHRHGIYYGGYYRPGYGWNRNVTVVNNNNYYWRPNPAKPRPRPPYQPGRPGGQLPGWRPPPGGKPPGGKPPGGKPPGGGPGNPGKPGFPGGPGGGPGGPNKPPPTGGGPNRPGKPGGKPGSGGPSIQPVKPKPGNTRPAPGQPSQPSVKPSVKPAPNRGGGPSAKPMPSPTPHEFNRQRPDTKRNSTHPAAQPAPRPAPSTRPAPSQRPAPSAQPAAQKPQRPAPAPGSQR